MKRLRLYTTILSACAALVLLISPVAAHAAPRDEAAMETVATQLTGLWSFVDASDQLSAEQFYPEFIKRESQVHTEITRAHDQLNATTETGDAAASLQDVQGKIKVMLRQLDAWQAAAKASDVEAFQSASDKLGVTAAEYNDAVVAYNSAAYGSKATAAIIKYVSILLVSFAGTMLLFAHAFYANTKDLQDAAQEILRRLRWHEAFVSIVVLVGVLVPVYIFFFTEATPQWWAWSLSGVGLILLCVDFYRAFKVRKLVKKHV